jgi:uncharacterized membrane protein YhaH (DUF805 family)
MKVTFAGAVKSAFVNFAQFRGVSTRAQYWYFVLFTLLLSIVLGTVEAFIWPPVQTEDLMEALQQPTPLSNVAALVLLVPSISLTARRMRDAGWSAKWLFLFFLPLVPFAFGVVGAISYLDSLPSVGLEELAGLVPYFLPAILIALAVQVFWLVLCLLPTKTNDQGNRYAK